jgi:FkbH-like protein
MIVNKVKLVVWDLDDTFWTGTLLEGGMVSIARNVEMVKELSRRGIVNSICSKNGYEEAKAALTELGIWDHFVFPHIAFSPKGQAIANMLEGAGLRAENTLFIDDNPSNLEEVKFFNPAIMTAHPAEVLEALLDHPHCAGTPDPELTRLKQYQFLQRKVEEKSASTLSNEEFLRASNLRIEIDRDIEANFDRVVDLINRTNQLNYTKKRLNTPEEMREFRKLLRRFGHQFGCIRAVDNYGDYGLIGFFLMKKRPNSTRLIHFVFSCRTMNMGIEQYVYDMLGRPDIEIAAPVSYGLDTHPKIDWINAAERDDAGATPIAKSWKLVLLGGCDLLQLASYCSTDRVEFVNRMRGDVKVRYDDPGFILADRTVLKAYDHLLPYWNYADAVQFDEGIASARLILLCMGGGMNGLYYSIRDAVQVRMARPWAKKVEEKDPQSFAENFRQLSLTDDDRLKLILAAFDAVAARRHPEAHVFVIATYTKGLAEAPAERRGPINTAYRDYCAARSRFHYIDLDAILSPEQLVGTRHFNPLGYYSLARHILEVASKLEEPKGGAASVLAAAAA